MLGDTIAAISTPHGKGGVAMLRVSGPEAIAVAGRVCATVTDTAGLTAAKSRFSYLCTVSAPENERPDAPFVPVDTGLVTVFRAPHSFTGEDVAEICVHGGILLTETVLSALFCAGARPAGPGEFTRRAFINGKMGLPSAEALRDLLEATSREQIKLSHAGMEGKLTRALEKPYATLTRLMAALYASIDFPDEDLAEVGEDEMYASLCDVRDEIQKLCDTYRTGHAIIEGIPTVLCGRVNAGKSSLFNRLVGRDAAIVTDVEGTTRDVLSETVTLGRVTLRLHDTAGLRETGDAVETIGIRRAREEMERAELILWLLDGSRVPDEEDRALAASLAGNTHAAVVALVTKGDLPQRSEAAALAKTLPHAVFLSAATGEGIDALTALVNDLFTDGTLSADNDAIVTGARQFADLRAALSDLEDALTNLRAGLPQDIVGESVENAMTAIGRVDGRTAGEDIVGEIFSHFCVGK